MKKLGKAIEKIFIGLGIALMIWGFASWCDVVADNCEPNPTHSEYNLFVLMTKGLE